MENINLFSHEQLRHDGDNPRRFYPQKDLQSLSDTIEANKGVDLALLVYPDGELGDGRPKFRVVDGNLRFAAAKLLGNEAPLLKCEVIEKPDRKSKLLIMGRSSEQHYAKDPISEAELYRKLKDEEGMSVSAIARELGCSIPKIANSLKLLELEGPIQDLIARKKLPRDRRAVNALMTVEESDKRVKLAEELAKRRAAISTVVQACERWNYRRDIHTRNGWIEDVRDKKATSGLVEAAVQIGKESLGHAERVDWEDVREALQEVCGACDIKLDSLKEVAEPAWSLISHAADETCQLCSLKTVRELCRGCGLTEFLVRLERAMTERQRG